MSETIQENETKKLIAHEIERYDIKTEAKLLKALESMFEEQTCLVSEDEIINASGIMVVDPAHVYLVVAKTSRAKIILRRFYKPSDSHNEPVFTFRDEKGFYQAGNSLYSSDYFSNILKVINSYTDNFRIRIGTDNPAIIETEDFRFLLAPRIESD